MDDVVQRLRTELSGRYEVQHELGRGGMAVVYLAKDLRHDRQVAIKVLRSDLGFAAAGERFLREIRTAAQLHHAHILPLYDSGTAGDYLFYVMPYMEGETVRQRLEREGPLTVEEAVRITREVADALAFAHERGIVHRDIKPENIFLSSGHAAVGDFGIARAADAAGLKLTEAGIAVGTPTYMSPEQATGDPDVDGRADQYALGCVLYELLAGQPPFTGPTSQAVMARHATDAVPPLTTVRAVPQGLDTAVRKALAKVPADRWPSTRAFAEALERSVAAPLSGEVATTDASRRRWMILSLGVTAALIIGMVVWRSIASLGRVAVSSGTDSLRSVAVLPFTINGDTTQFMIADGMTEGLITGLVRVEGLRIPASGRMLAYRDRQEDLRVVGKELGVNAMVTGGVQVAGNQLRVTAQLTRAADGLVLWREQFNGELVINGQLKDLFTIQDEITGRIVDALLPRLAPASRATLARGVRTRDPEAWSLYQQARRESNQLTEASTRRAKALLEQAIARDSAFSDAWAALVTVLDYYARFSTDPPEESNVAMRRAANRAVELDSLNGLALAARGWTRALNDWDWDGALRDLRQAQRLSPGSHEGEYPFLLLFLGQPDSALAHARRTADPTSAGWWDMLAWCLAAVGQADSALVAGERAVALDSNFSNAYLGLAQWYLDAGRRADADRTNARYLGFSGNDAQGIGWSAVYYRRAGDRKGAQAMMDRLTMVRRERSWGVNSAMSMVRLGLGDRAGALDALEAAARAREYLLPATLAQALAPLRGEPRFEAVRRRVFGDRTPPPILFP